MRRCCPGPSAWRTQHATAQDVDALLLWQGVREKEGELYHNRADDGFLYFSCGSYSTGPVSLGEDATLVSSLTFSERRHLINLRCVANPAASGKWTLDSSIHTPLARAPTGDSRHDAVPTPPVLTLERELGCWMPSGGAMQIQRAKWGQHSPQVLQASAAGAASSWDPTLAVWQQGEGGMSAWVTLGSATESGQKGLWTAWDHGEPADNALIVQVGALCHTTVNPKS